MKQKVGILRRFYNYFADSTEKSAEEQALKIALLSTLVNGIVVCIARFNSEYYPEFGITYNEFRAHHYNWGFFFIENLCLYLLFRLNSRRERFVMIVLYAIGCALFYDEWLMVWKLEDGSARDSFIGIYIWVIKMVLVIVGTQIYARAKRKKQQRLAMATSNAATETAS